MVCVPVPVGTLPRGAFSGCAVRGPGAEPALVSSLLHGFVFAMLQIVRNRTHGSVVCRFVRVSSPLA